MQELVKPHNIHKLLAKINQTDYTPTHPLCKIRSLINKNPFLNDFHPIKLNSHKIRLSKPPLFLIKTNEKSSIFEQFNDFSLSVTRPYNTSSRREMNSQFHGRNTGRSVCQGGYKGKTEAFLEEDFEFPRRNHIDFLKKHEKGYNNTENEDLFKHFFRIFLKDKAFLSQSNGELALKLFKKALITQKKMQIDKDISQINTEKLIFDENKNIFQGKIKDFQFSLDMKEFLIRKARLDLKLFEKIAKYTKSDDKIHEKNYSKELSFTTKEFEGFKRDEKISQKFFREDVFLENILEKVKKYGISHIAGEELENLEKIIKERKKILENLEFSIKAEKIQNLPENHQFINKSPKNLKQELQNKHEFNKEEGYFHAFSIYDQEEPTEISPKSKKTYYKPAKFMRIKLKTDENSTKLSAISTNKAKIFIKPSNIEAKGIEEVYKQLLKERLRDNRKIFEDIQKIPQKNIEFNEYEVDSNQDMGREISEKESFSGDLWTSKEEIDDKIEKNLYINKRNMLKNKKNEKVNENDKIQRKTEKIGKDNLSEKKENLQNIPQIIKENIHILKENSEILKNSPQILKENPRILKDNHVMLKEKKELFKENLDLFKENPDLFKENHEFIKDIPDFFKENPTFLKENIQFFNDNPEILKENPQLIMDNPELFLENTDFLMKNPNIFLENPEILLQNQVKSKETTELIEKIKIFKQNPNILKENPVFFKETIEKLKKNQEILKKNKKFFKDSLPHIETIVKNSEIVKDIPQNLSKEHILDNKIERNSLENPINMKIHSKIIKNEKHNSFFEKQQSFNILERKSLETIRKSDASIQNHIEPVSKSTKTIEKIEKGKKMINKSKKPEKPEKPENLPKSLKIPLKKISKKEKHIKKPNKLENKDVEIAEISKEIEIQPNNLQTNLMEMSLKEKTSKNVKKPRNYASEGKKHIVKKSFINEISQGSKPNSAQKITVSQERSEIHNNEHIPVFPDKIDLSLELENELDFLDSSKKINISTNQIKIPSLPLTPKQRKDLNSKDSARIDSKEQILKESAMRNQSKELIKQGNNNNKQEKEDEEDNRKYDNIELEEDPDLKLDFSPGLSLNNKNMKNIITDEDERKSGISVFLKKKMQNLTNLEVNTSNFSPNKIIENTSNVMKKLFDLKGMEISRASENDPQRKLSDDPIQQDNSRKNSEDIDKSKSPQSPEIITKGNKSHLTRNSQDLSIDSPTTFKKKKGYDLDSNSPLKKKLNVLDGEELNLRKLKENIEENLDDMTEQRDSDAKYTMFIYNQRKEQIDKFLRQIESNIEENILTESDCNDQLRHFLEMRSRFNRENEINTNNLLKFSNQISISNNDHLIKTDVSQNESQNIENLAKYMSLNQDLLSEKQRRKLFLTQQKMLNLLRKFMNRCQSQVKQKSQGTATLQANNTSEINLIYEIMRIDENNEHKLKKSSNIEESNKSHSSFDRSYQKYYNSLKKLKAKHKPEFDQVVNKFKDIKGKINFTFDKYLK